MQDSREQLESIIKHGLCTRCGSCVGLGGGHVHFEDKTGKYLPFVDKNIDSKLAEQCLQACSGADVDFPAIDKYCFSGEGNHHEYLGTYQSLNIGFSSDPGIRRQGGSAGVISTTLIYLLENKLVDGALVLGMSEEEPWMNKPFIATSREEILKAAQSKYTISSVNEILPQIADFKGKLAYTALPCQVHSIRKLQMMKHPWVQNIEYVIAPFCGLNLHFSSIKSFLRSHGASDYKSIKELKFREGEWPGHMKVEMNDGRVFQLPKFHANYLIPFHMMKRCWLCIDAANEFADISVGDAWAPVYEERGKGFSFVIVRSTKAKELTDSMLKENKLDFQALTPKEAVKMHSHMYDNKKRGAFIRIKKRRHSPDYHLPFPENIGFGRRFFEFSLNLIYTILRTRFVTFLIDILPSGLVGRTFDSFKRFWKKMTYSVKRKDL